MTPLPGFNPFSFPIIFPLIFGEFPIPQLAVFLFELELFNVLIEAVLLAFSLSSFF